MASAVRAALLVTFAVVAAGCHAQPVPLLGIGPMRPNDPTLYDDALAASREEGHPPVSLDPEHGRFAVRAQSEVTRQTIFVIQCSRDGFVTVTPSGGRVERIGDAFIVSPSLREEWTRLVNALERGIPETR